MVHRYIFTLLTICAVTVSGCKKPVDQRSLIIIPLASVASSTVQMVHDSLEAVYGLAVTIGDLEPLPESAFVQIKSPRYRADSLLKYLKKRHLDYDHVMGITGKDISITKYANRLTGKVKEPEWKYRDFGIFGLGMRPGRACVVSTYRLGNKVSRETFRRRTVLIAVHEVGHNLGLKHCPDRSCLMTDAMESIRTIDQCSGKLCESCRSKIR